MPSSIVILKLQVFTDNLTELFGYYFSNDRVVPQLWNFTKMEVLRCLNETEMKSIAK